MAGATSGASISTCSSIDHEDPVVDVFSDLTSVSLLQFRGLASRLLVVATLVAQPSCADNHVLVQRIARPCCMDSSCKVWLDPSLSWGAIQ